MEVFKSSHLSDSLICSLVLPSERCKLICKVSDDRLERSFVLGDRVEDGTPCGREEDTRDICISGVCMPIGCDHKYGSNATEDVCGVCNGQNRTCKLVNGQRIVSDFGSYSARSRGEKRTVAYRSRNYEYCGYSDQHHPCQCHSTVDRQRSLLLR